MAHNAFCRSIGIGDLRVLDVHLSGLRALDLYRVCQIGHGFDVSVDWLLGRTDVMNLPGLRPKPSIVRLPHPRNGLLR